MCFTNFCISITVNIALVCKQHDTKFGENTVCVGSARYVHLLPLKYVVVEFCMSTDCEVVHDICKEVMFNSIT